MKTPTPAASDAVPARVTATAAATLPPATSTRPAGAATEAPANTPQVLSTRQPTADNSTGVLGQPQVTESILILTPGNGGAISSPVRVSGQADPTFEHNLVIEITDANGGLIATQPTTIQGSGAGRGPFDTQVPYSTTVEQPGRISVYSTSARDGGLIHLASLEVTLLSSGTAAITQGKPHNETHIILKPAAQATVTGGRLQVSGFSDYVFEAQLSLMLCGEGGPGGPDRVCGTVGNVLATGTAMIHALDVGQPGAFNGDLTYKVSTTVHARLAVYSRSARDGGIIHLSTVPVTLAP